MEFTLASVHVLWPEITAFAEWMRAWAVRPTDWNANLMVLGDFDLDRIGDPLYEAFIATGLWPPTELDKVPRTIFDNDTTQHFYDQIAWFSKADGTSLLQGLTYVQRAGSFDFIPQSTGGSPAATCVLAHLRPLSGLVRIPRRLTYVGRPRSGQLRSTNCRRRSGTPMSVSEVVRTGSGGITGRVQRIVDIG